MDITALPSHEVTALQFLREEAPLPIPPSPTLTNPDLVLPDGFDLPVMPSPARDYAAPPSPSYLRPKASDDSMARSATPRKEKRGLMSRKMMLLRSRTGSGMNVNGGQSQSSPANATSLATDMPMEEYTYASSPTLQDVGNLAPEQPDHKRMSTSGSSFNSDELAGIPSFLAKYDLTDGTGTDDESESDSLRQKKYGYSVSIEGGVNALRRQQEEDELNSAMLSKRAEQILANAKRRLNLMEGNLRGARDLVSPLTAANLKRAASLNLSYYAVQASNTRPGPGVYDSPADQHATRNLHAQQSSPNMGNAFHRPINRIDIPERPHTALERGTSFSRSGRIPVRVDPSWERGLRNSRSYDSLGSNSGAQHTASRARPLHTKGSPDANLEPLPEDEGSIQTPSDHDVSPEWEHNGLGIHKSLTKSTDNLRDQMSNLKGKISSLRERAREDSLRRQSLQNLRTPSPFNNAVDTAPEMFYTQSQNYGSPVLETNAGIGWAASTDHSAALGRHQLPSERSNALPGSRNAFAERAASHLSVQQLQPQLEREATTKSTRTLASETRLPQHRRTASGTAIVAPATNRYSHHQFGSRNNSQDSGVSQNYLMPVSKDLPAMVSPLASDESDTPDYDFVVSEDEQSVYEDAAYEQPPIVAHEDRTDAFDYENFFLHSAMGTYGITRRESVSSEGSASSTETARAPAAVSDEEDEDDHRFDPESSIFPPPTPETPERLRDIERSLHKRTFSEDSVSTLDTFATADEGQVSPTDRFTQSSALDWPILSQDNPARTSSRPDSRPSSRPGTAIKKSERRPNSSSDRADSGVGLPGRSNSSHGTQRSAVQTPRSPATVFASPPMSPRNAMLHDPATLAVNSLLDPNGKPLGLKDKAMLFSLVEALRKVCSTLQTGNEDHFESRELRRRLDDAKRTLNGSPVQRPSSHG